MKKKRKLTAKQQMFCREYLIDLNASKSIIRAGYKTKYPDKMGWQLLGNARVKERIDELIKEREKSTKLTAEYVLNGLIEVYEKCNKEVNGKIDSAGANRALELLGKHLKLFTEVIESKKDKVEEEDYVSRLRKMRDFVSNN